MKNKRGNRTGKFRSNLEAKVAKHLDSLGVSYNYESVKISYKVPATDHTYTPDFSILKSDGTMMHIEAKGLFDAEDRKKHLAIRAQYGRKLDIRFVFQVPNKLCWKGGKMTYKGWCEKHGFKYSEKFVDPSWLEE